MKQLIEYIVSNLVNHPEDVIVEEEKLSEGEEGLSNITIKVNPEDIGRVIGRSGKVINAIRQIARIAAIQKGIRVRVDLKDDGQPKPQGGDQPQMEQLEQSPDELPQEEPGEEPVEEPIEETPVLDEEIKD